VRALPASSAVAAERLADRLVDARLLEYVGTDVDGRHCYRMPNLSRLFAREEVFARKEATATSRGLLPNALANTPP
jgi:hypothetical protein